jgi:hypothetical protein
MLCMQIWEEHLGSDAYLSFVAILLPFIKHWFFVQCFVGYRGMLNWFNVIFAFGICQKTLDGFWRGRTSRDFRWMKIDYKLRKLPGLEKFIVRTWKKCSNFLHHNLWFYLFTLWSEKIWRSYKLWVYFIFIDSWWQLHKVASAEELVVVGLSFPIFQAVISMAGIWIISNRLDITTDQ